MKSSTMAGRRLRQEMQEGRSSNRKAVGATRSLKRQSTRTERRFARRLEMAELMDMFNAVDTHSMLSTIRVENESERARDDEYDDDFDGFDDGVDDYTDEVYYEDEQDDEDDGPEMLYPSDEDEEAIGIRPVMRW